MSRSIEGLLARVQHPLIKRMLALWQEKRGGRDWPLRSDFDPLEFGFAVGYVSLIDVLEGTAGDGTAAGRPGGQRRFRFRLDGTRQVELFGVDCTGKFLDQAVAPESARIAERSFGAAIDTGEPQYHVRNIEFHERVIGYEIAVLPMSRQGNRIDMLMTVVVPT
jgi:hypothetical protein